MDSTARDFPQAVPDRDPTGAEPDVPVLDAYRHPDGVHITTWCPHERRWHQHGICRQQPGCARLDASSYDGRGCTCPPGSGDGHRGAHCTCRQTPYASGYYLREVGTYGPGVPHYVDEDTAPIWACQSWAGYPCTGCKQQGRCSCDQVKCPDDSLCAEHADTACPSCWATHGGPGYGHCETHGIVAMHVHSNRRACRADGDGTCEIAYLVSMFWPPDGVQAHAHCPLCWALNMLRARDPDTGQWFTTPPCKGCRVLVGADQLARITACMDEEARLSAEMQTWLNALPAAEKAERLAALDGFITAIEAETARGRLPHPGGSR